MLTPKVIKVEARQFPVTLHFEKRTPEDYIASAFRKTCRIHETLPPGAILVFVTGQNEVRQLMAKLKKRYPVVYETAKNGEVLVKGTKEWKERKVEAAKSIRLEDFKEELNGDDDVEDEENGLMDGDDMNERGAAEAFDDYEEFENGDGDLEDGKVENTVGPPPADCEPLYCLPLYSLLSMGKQRRVFDETPAGMRLCVISTNVAETSLTIPGVKYVIDGGFEKRRLYDSITGVSRFAVCRISQASADQRAGRAGRIAAGHAYRLYSSAVFQDLVKFADPEILTKPADQLVLHLKSMNIVKVVNFPFPSAPDEKMLEAAEQRLCRLGALSESTINGKTEARITKLGKTLAVFPLAPPYAKFIAMADQHNLMSHAILLISLLSVREPLIPVASLRGATPEETKELMKNVLKERRRWCSQSAARRLGDLKVLMHAASVAEQVKYNPQECEKVGLRVKALVEARKLRQQLTNIVNASSKKASAVTIDPNLPPPTDQQAQLLRQMVVASFADRIARRVDRSIGQEEVQKGAYETTLIKEHVFIDPCSVLFTEEPEFVIFQEIVQVNEKKLLTSVCSVDKEWLSRLAESYCHFGDQDKNQEPKYDEVKDCVVKSVKVTFGPMEWELPVENRIVPHDILMYRWFAVFLLDGLVFEKLKEFVPKLLAPPTTMVKSWAKLQKRTESLLNRLIEKEVCIFYSHNSWASCPTKWAIAPCKRQLRPCQWAKRPFAWGYRPFGGRLAHSVGDSPQWQSARSPLVHPFVFCGPTFLPIRSQYIEYNQ
uniref:Helicase C-terminal domain-containing protein n=1 Tax=Caenorhabditis japonica TaxID=281687 RepID=A0A8R1DQJ0_CAEJA